MTLAAGSGTVGPPSSAMGVASELRSGSGSGSWDFLGGADEPLDEITRRGDSDVGSDSGSDSGSGSGSSSALSSLACNGDAVAAIARVSTEPPKQGLAQALVKVATLVLFLE